jgi:hypothetical protein
MKLYLPNRFKFGFLAAGLIAACSSMHAQTVTNPPQVLVVAPDPTALEGTSSGAFTLIRVGSKDADLNVNLQLSGTASNGVDYVTISNVITIPAGSVATDVKVDPIVDNANRGNKTVVLMLETNSSYILGEHRWASVKIIDDIFDLLPPTISITAPTNNSSFTNPPSIAITTDVNDADAAVKSVSFYANDDFLGRATNAPFSLTWSNPPTGHFSIFARAVDQFGRSALSAPVHITVTELRPIVKITSPTNGANFVVHQNITVSAEASDPDGTDTISSVSFYANDHLLGVATNAPYSLVWSNAPGGLFALHAVAVDSSGDKGYSHPVFINVTPLRLRTFSK